MHGVVIQQATVHSGIKVTAQKCELRNLAGLPRTAVYRDETSTYMGAAYTGNTADFRLSGAGLTGLYLF
jgi:hypothetical protein